MPPPRPNTGEGGASSAPPLSCKPPRATSPTATQRCSPSAPLRWAATEVASYHTIARRTSAWFFSGDDDVAVPSDAALLRSLLYRSSPHMAAGAGLPWSSVHTWPLRYLSPGSRSWVSLRASLFPFTIDAAGVRYLVVVKKPSVVDPTPHVCPARYTRDRRAWAGLQGRQARHAPAEEEGASSVVFALSPPTHVLLLPLRHRKQFAQALDQPEGGPHHIQDDVVSLATPQLWRGRCPASATTCTIGWDVLPPTCAFAGRVGWAWSCRLPPALHHHHVTAMTTNIKVRHSC